MKQFSGEVCRSVVFPRISCWYSWHSNLILPSALSRPRSFTLPSLTAKGPSIGVLLLGCLYMVSIWDSREKITCTMRFIVRSFFVGPIEEPHVKKIVEKLGGPELKVSITWSWNLTEQKDLWGFSPKNFFCRWTHQGSRSQLGGPSMAGLLARQSLIFLNCHDHLKFPNPSQSQPSFRLRSSSEGGARHAFWPGGT